MLQPVNCAEQPEEGAEGKMNEERLFREGVS